MIKDYFPHERFIGEQERILDKIEERINMGFKVINLAAPTGAGKSPMNLAILKYFGSGYYTTPLKTLQDQINDDYPEVPQLKGRANYECIGVDEKISCATAPCIYKKCVRGRIKRNCGEHSILCSKTYNPEKPCSCDAKLCVDCPCWDCLYKEALNKFKNSPISMTNTMMFLMMSHQLEFRRVLVIDEAHKMDSFIVNKSSLTLSTYNFSKLDDDADFSEYCVALEDYLEKITYHITDLTENMATSKTVRVDDVQKLEQLRRQKDKINFLLNDWGEHEEPWDFKFIRVPDSGKIVKIKFKPIDVRRFMAKMFGKAEYIIMSSGTPLRSFELPTPPENIARINMDSIIKPENRPIFYRPVGRMSLKYRDNTYSKMAKEIKNIVGMDLGNAMVHCHSYVIMDALHIELEKLDVPHLTQSRRNREGSLRFWKENEECRLFLSVNMIEGLDLKGDLCRVNILAKVPYEYLGDGRVKKLISHEDFGWRWFNLQAARSIQQAYGRAVRGEDDWAVFYILDKSFSRLWNLNKDLFEKYFISGKTE